MGFYKLDEKMKMILKGILYKMNYSLKLEGHLKGGVVLMEGLIPIKHCLALPGKEVLMVYINLSVMYVVMRAYNMRPHNDQLLLPVSIDY